MDTESVIATLRDAASSLRQGDARTRLRAIQAAQDALDSAKACAASELVGTREFEMDGASSASTWIKNELRLDPRETKALLRAGETLAQLPEVAAAAASGTVRLAHVAVFGFGLRHIGADTVVDAQPWLLDVARTCEPAELRRIVRGLREAVYPEELDQAWIDGMDKQDIQVQRLPDGWSVQGFLSISTGGKLRAVLDGISAPRDADDTRTGAERRVQGLDDLLTAVLNGGLPSDKGIRPHLSILVDTTEPAPATLAGFGTIGPRLLDYLTCTADVTAIRVKNRAVVDVGRSHRLATLAQRRAVLARQHGECAAPGCSHVHLEIHHIVWWSRGGRTDLDNLVGLCSRCHHLVHRGLLTLTGPADRLTFARSNGRTVPRRARWSRFRAPGGQGVPRPLPLIHPRT